MLAATADPEAPNEVNVSQPSATLTARADAQGAFNGLFLGLGAVALLVGAVGVANIMVISVLERRSEIGLRRALGATRGQIRTQFLSEAILLALGGGAVGVATGALATAIYASTKGWAIVIPTLAWAGGFGAAHADRRRRRPAPRAARRAALTHRSATDRVITPDATTTAAVSPRCGLRPLEAVQTAALTRKQAQPHSRARLLEWTSCTRAARRSC